MNGPQRFFSNQTKALISWACFVITLFAIGMIILKILQHPSPMKMFLASISFFTTQSVVLACFVMGLSVFKKEENKWFSYLSFIALIDIIVTTIVFNFVLVLMMDGYPFFQLMMHVIVPVCYLFYYFFIVKSTIKKQEIWIVLVHPFIFLVLVFTIINPFLGEVLVETVQDFNSSPYVYPFLDPQYFKDSIALTMILNALILSPTILLLSYGLRQWKIKIKNTMSIKKKYP
jgi:hypothetical protein